VRERHPDGRFEEAHVLDRWRHVGTARDASGLEGLLEARVDTELDPDVYRIVRAFIAKHPAALRPVAPARERVEEPDAWHEPA